MLKISDQLFVDILIDNRPIPPTNGLFSSLFIYEGNGFPFPSLELNLHDTLGSLSKDLALTEGNEISIMVGTDDSNNKLRYRQFRFFSCRQQVGSAGPTLQIFAVYNSPSFIQKSTRESYEGNSSQVLKILAETSNLTYDGPETFNGRTPDDSQIWRNVGKTRTAFARKIAMHGWVSEGSCMSYVITSDGVLRYRNLNDVINGDINKITNAFVQNISNRESSTYTKHRVIEARDRSDAGMSNAWMNYGHLRINHQATGEPLVLDKIAVPTIAEKFPISRKISEVIKDSRVDYGLIDGDNVHIHYEEAIYQNIRLLSLFNQRMSLLVDRPTEVNVFDLVLYRQQDLDEYDIKNSDQYILFGKTIAVIQGSNYCERLEIGRQEVTMPSGDMKTSLSDSINDLLPSFDIGGVTGSSIGFQGVLDIARNALSIVNQAKVAISNFRKNGPQLIRQALLNGAISSVRESSIEFLGDLKINGGDGVDTGLNLSNSFTQLRIAYDDARQIYGQIAQPLSQLGGLLASASPGLRRSVINSLPLDLDSLVGSAVSTITHTQSVNHMLGIINAVGGMSGASYMPEIAGLARSIERLPGFPSLPGLTGTGPNKISGYPGYVFADFNNIPNTNYPGIPGYQGIENVFGKKLDLPSLPLIKTLLNPFNQVLQSQTQLVSSATKLIGLVQNLRLPDPLIANVLNIDTYNKTVQPPLQSSFLKYQTEVAASLKTINIEGLLPEYNLPSGSSTSALYDNINQDSKVAEANMDSCTSNSTPWSFQ